LSGKSKTNTPDCDIGSRPHTSVPVAELVAMKLVDLLVFLSVVSFVLLSGLIVLAIFWL
jgi:hypothetical protein